METKYAYASYGLYEINFNKENGTFTVGYGKNKSVVSGKITADLRDYSCVAEYVPENRKNIIHIRYEKGESNITLSFSVGFEGVQAELKGAKAEGTLNFGDVDNLFPMCSKTKKGVLQSSLGYAVPDGADMLFNRETDSAIYTDNLKIKFDYENNIYSFASDGGFTLSVLEDVYKNKYHVEYKGMNKNNTFGKLPPVGWMSWYAVKFRASEKTVLDNALWQSENLKDYGANAIWVDWEWYHKGLEAEGIRDDGVDSFHPDPNMYPNGLKYVSDEIRKMGLIPNLWIGFSNETFETEYMKENPESVLVKELTWAGSYFFDMTHPKYLNDYLPRALAQVDEWGYEGVKFDTLPIFMERQEKYHEYLYDKELTVYEMYRNLIKKTREVLGKDRYILSCSGEKHPNIVWAGDFFDAARIGGDIFKWEEFLNNCLYRTMEFYHFHNIMFYNDPDNIVLREEFNTLTQSISRATFVSMLGMPVTFGDELYNLPENRVDIIKRIIPSLDIRPSSVETDVNNDKILVTNLSIGLEWENYNVVSVFNTSEEEESYTLDLKNTLGLYGEYFVYDFWNKKNLGLVSDFVDLKLKPCETRVLSVRQKRDVPQIVSTNRHITQGAAEITSLKYQGDKIKLRCNLVGKDLYKVYVNVPTDYEMVSYDKFSLETEDGLTVLSFMPDKTKEYTFELEFRKK